MSEAKHTPAPWSVRSEKWVVATRGEHSGKILIAPTYWMEHVPQEAAANARLIAAVPELLAAAEKHLKALDEEASANMALDNAEANFSDARPEIRRAGIAMVAASTAAKELRAVIAKATEAQ